MAPSFSQLYLKVSSEVTSPFKELFVKVYIYLSLQNSFMFGVFFILRKLGFSVVQSKLVQSSLVRSSVWSPIHSLPSRKT